MKVFLEVCVNGDDEASARVAGALRADILTDEIGTLEPRSRSSSDSRAVDVTDLTAFFVSLPPTIHALKSLVAVVQRWVSGPTRSVVVQIGEDRLELTGTSAEQQTDAAEAWIRRHTAS
jgi:hypothetical protein